MLTLVIRTSKNFLVSENLLNRGVVGKIGLRGRSMDVVLLLTPRWCRGPRGVALLRLATVPRKVFGAPAVDA
jgi:hypothetical protein